jgi:hypothetical protein
VEEFNKKRKGKDENSARRPALENLFLLVAFLIAQMA